VVRAAHDARSGVCVAARLTWCGGDRVSAPGEEVAFQAAAELAAAAGFDVLELDLTRDNDGARTQGAELVAATRSAWRDGRPLIATIGVGRSFGAHVSAEQAIATALRLGLAGADLIGVAAAPHGVDIVEQTLASERIRQETGLPTMMAGGIAGDDHANTLILSGRADLCRGRPMLGMRAWDSRA